MGRPSLGLEGGGVYEILNLVNGERYIGSAARFHQRFYQHKLGLRAGRHTGRKLQAAWIEYGEEAFEFIPLETIENPTRERLQEREQSYMDLLSPEYNILPRAYSPAGRKMPEKFVEALKASWADPVRRAKRVAAIKAVQDTPEWRENVLASKNTPEYRARRSRLSLEQLNRHDLAEYIRENGHAGHAPETRERIAESNRAVRATWTPEQTKRLTDAATAARDNPTTRERMSAAKKGRPSVKRADPTKCAKLLHVWVDGRRECLECRRATDEARRRALGMKPQSERDYKNVSAETRKKISDSLRDESADSKSTRWRRSREVGVRISPAGTLFPEGSTQAVRFRGPL